ncbi:MAG: NADAR family protein [Candidatus Nanoarchaeia archaeon]|nr:NADAR family protein [Candidatus Nanoarchaeia archaeon]
MNMRTTNTHIYFWGSFLSNWIPSNLSIEFDDNIFTNSEQIFMYLKAKYFKDEETAKEIVELGTDPKIAKDLGRKVKNYNEKTWNNVREEMMYRAVLAKFNSDKTLHDKLIKTENKILVEGSPFDPIWGVKIRWDDNRILDEKNWEGQNLLGKVLMKVRETLKQIYK